MTPTTKLRFVERTQVTQMVSDTTAEVRRIRILQQWWQGEYAGEWRDVEVVNE